MISLGYSTIDDRSQISFDAARLLIGKLAQFHASSLVLDNQNDDTVSKLNEVFFDYHIEKSAYCEDMDNYIGKMKELNGLENIVEKLEGSTEEMFDAVRDLFYSPDAAQCKVLCHGDMKFENTLIKMSDTGVDNAVFVRMRNIRYKFSKTLIHFFC